MCGNQLGLANFASCEGKFKKRKKKRDTAERGRGSTSAGYYHLSSGKQHLTRHSMHAEDQTRKAVLLHLFYKLESKGRNSPSEINRQPLLTTCSKTSSNRRDLTALYERRCFCWPNLQHEWQPLLQLVLHPCPSGTVSLSLIQEEF